MAKTFYTQHDIQDLAARGVTRLEVNDDVVFTDLAREQVLKLGIELVRSDAPHPPLPVAETAPVAAPATAARPALHDRIRSAVIAKLGDQVNPAILDRIITRVLANIACR